MAIFCFSPPERFSAFLSAKLSSFISAMILSTTS